MANMFDTQAEEIDSRRKYAEALRQQGMQPLQSQTAGGYVIPINPLQGLAQMLQSYSGRKGIEQAAADKNALAEKRAQALQEYGQSFPTPQSLPVGTGATGGLDSEDSPFVMQGGVKKPTPQDYAQFLARGAAIGPDAVNFGNSMVNLQSRADEADDMRKFRADESRLTREARAAELERARVEAAERQRRDQDFKDAQARQAAADRENLARVAAGLRPAPAPSAPIITDTGIYERNRDGSLRQLVDPVTNKPLMPKAPAGKAGKTDVEKTMDLYMAASNGLVSGLANASTGPLAGRIPAMTTNAQVADGGVAAMAPVLKQLFRVAGEGTFTDQDQKILLDMLPTRKDSPEAAKAKMSNIDNIVAAKLGLPIPEREWGGKTKGITQSNQPKVVDW